MMLAGTITHSMGWSSGPLMQGIGMDSAVWRGEEGGDRRGGERETESEGGQVLL